MKQKTRIGVILIFAIIFTILFYHQRLGINLFIFEVLSFGWLYFSKQISFNTFYQKFISFGVLLTALVYVIQYSTHTLWINILFLFLFIGIHAYPKAKSLFTSFLISIYSIINTPRLLSKDIEDFNIEGEGDRMILGKLKYILVSTAIVFTFFILYSNSSPDFHKILTKLSQFFEETIFVYFSNIDFNILYVFIIGIIISSPMYYLSRKNKIINFDKKQVENLSTGTEQDELIPFLNKIGILLFSTLNIFLIYLNISDVNWVWLNFVWDGFYLKSFLHQGTYYLIFSIVLSIGLVMYFFRQDLNFYNKNKFLKGLVYFWLIQNTVLALSVIVRTYRYIEYFSLAYRRIGVIFFVVFCLFMIYSVFIKVREKKTFFYFLKFNSFSFVAILLVFSLFNWDTIIAKYNFRYSNQSFLDLNFMSNLSNKTLPYIDVGKDKLSKIQIIQDDKFSFSKRKIYMKPDIYLEKIQKKKMRFKKKWAK